VSASTSKPIPDAQTVTLLLTPQQTELLFLAEQNGTLRADLRGVSDQAVTDPGVVKLFDVLPPTDLAGIPDSLKPNGYKAGQ
jgi:Flp pilus assembly protein CpaB